MPQRRPASRSGSEARPWPVSNATLVYFALWGVAALVALGLALASCHGEGTASWPATGPASASTSAPS